MHYSKGKSLKIPYLCIVWSPQNGSHLMTPDKPSPRFWDVFCWSILPNSTQHSIPYTTPRLSFRPHPNAALVIGTPVSQSCWGERNKRKVAARAAARQERKGLWLPEVRKELRVATCGAQSCQMFFMDTLLNPVEWSFGFKQKCGTPFKKDRGQKNSWTWKHQQRFRYLDLVVCYIYGIFMLGGPILQKKNVSAFSLTFFAELSLVDPSETPWGKEIGQKKMTVLGGSSHLVSG